MIADTAVDFKVAPIQLSEKQQKEIAEFAAFQPQVTGHWLNNHISTLPDLTTGESISYHELINQSHVLPAEWFEENGTATPPVEYAEFTSDQTEAMVYAYNILKLSGPVITREVMDLKSSIDDMTQKYGIPLSDVKPASLVSFGLLSLQGKTMLGTALRLSGETVVSLSGFSGDNLEKYWAALGEDPESLTIEEVVAKIQSTFNSETPSTPKTSKPWTASEALDKLCSVFENGHRPELVICDMPGVRLSRPGEESRMVNIFDFLRTASMEMVDLSVRQGNDLVPDGTTDWRVTQDYLDKFKLIRSHLVAVCESRNQLFYDMVTGNELGNEIHTGIWEINRNELATKLAEVEAEHLNQLKDLVQ